MLNPSHERQLAAALQALADAEATYRQAYERKGGHALETGHAWDRMRRAGDNARVLLSPRPPTDGGGSPNVAHVRPVLQDAA